MPKNKIEEEFFLDKAQQEVRVGDYIVYGHALGRCVGLRFGIVLRIMSEPHSFRDNEKSWKITVRGINDDWCHKEVELCDKNGTLQFPERIIKANDFIPDSYSEA